MFRQARLLPPPTDAAIVVLVGAFVVGATTASGYWHGTPLGPGGYAWLAGCVVPLLWRRAFPLPAFVLSAALVFGYYLSPYPGGPAILAPTIGLVGLTVYRGWARAACAAVVVLAALVIVDVATGRLATVTGPTGVVYVLWAVAAISVGAAARARRASVLAQRSAAEQAQLRRADEERLRIAREVHDVVAHSLSVINVQASVASHVADRRPEQAVLALDEIKQASGHALADLRATLAVLRSGAELAPAPGLAGLHELAETARAAGIELLVHGEPEGLPAPVDAAAYRIVQESVTNTIRHSTGAGTITVNLAPTADALELTVRDDGTAPGEPDGAGYGLRGLAERAQALGGTVRTGAATDGGFEVTAVLPIQGGRP